MRKNNYSIYFYSKLEIFYRLGINLVEDKISRYPTKLWRYIHTYSTFIIVFLFVHINCVVRLHRHKRNTLHL